MAYLKTKIPYNQEGEFSDSEGNSRSVVVLGRTVIDKDDACRIAKHFFDRQESGSLPYAAECREIAIPIMQALVDAGYHISE